MQGGRACVEGESKVTGRPAMKLIEASKIQSEGLSSSVKKVLALVTKSSNQERKSIKRFFGPSSARTT